MKIFSKIRRSKNIAEVFLIVYIGQACFTKGIKTCFARCKPCERDDSVTYPGKNNSAHKQESEKGQGRARELRKHHKGLIPGGGDHSTHYGAERDRAVDIKTDVHEGTQAAGGRA